MRREHLFAAIILLAVVVCLPLQSFGQGSSGTNPGISLYRYNSSPTGSPIPVLNGDLLGTLKWNGLVNYGDIRTGAAIQSFVTDPVGPGFQANMIFRTSGPGGLTNRMIITEEGRVGIGTDNPAFDLHTVGNTHTTGDFYGRIHFDANAGTNDAPNTYIDEAYFELKNRAILTGGSLLPAAAGVQGGVLSLAPGGSSLDHQLYFGEDGIWTRRQNGGALNWTGADWYKVLTGENIHGTENQLAKFTGPNALGDSRLFDNGMRVGIGNSAPATDLDITGATRISGNLGVGTLPSGTFRLDVSGTSQLNGNTNVTGNLGIGTPASGFRLDVNGESNFSGRVKIGASFFPTSTAYELAVGGGIIAEEVRVQLQPWADYVFDENYELQPLSEVERYIQKNKHLPGVASAQEVAEKGLNLGEMQKAQMEKIEEIYLYVIQQQKLIEQQQKTIERLESEINNLKK